MKKIFKKTLYFTPLIILGLFIFVYGGADDSPGAQLLGIIIALVGIVGLVKLGRKWQS